MTNKNRLPTEKITLSDIFDNFENEYKEFVEWFVVDMDNNIYKTEVIFLEDAPVQYKNKWNRDQWKIEVESDGTLKMLSGGKRLFTALKNLCLANTQQPSQLGSVEIRRKGNGFDTSYVMFKVLKQQKLNTQNQ